MAHEFMCARNSATTILGRENGKVLSILDQLSGQLVGCLRVGIRDICNDALKVLDRALKPDDWEHFVPELP